MRARNIKPGFFKNDELAECSPLARILFEGLWCFADRNGRFKARPKKIKAEILPYDNGEITVMLQELNDKGFIRFYSVNGCAYGEVMNFLKHQNPHHTEKPSEIPPFDSNGEITVKELLKSRNAPADSLIPDSLIPDSTNSASKGENYTETFISFWENYPKKKSKGNAFKAWKRIKDKPPMEVILKSIEANKKTWDWKKEGGQFIPYPASWLNSRGWEDEIDGEQGNGEGPIDPFLRSLRERANAESSG